MTKEQAIRTAVKWWSNKLRSRAPHDNGDTSTASVMACFLTDMLAKLITDEQLEVFETELTKALETELDGHRYVLLMVDYNPCELLYNAAKTAGIPEFNFPYKTDVCVQVDGENVSVLVSDGYGRPYISIDPID